MADTIDDLEKKVLELPEAVRGRLAESLIRSLPGVLHDDDEGMAEAQRRAADLDAYPEKALSLAELRAAARQRT